MRLSSPRILIAGASVAALAAAGGVAVAATGDAPSKPAAKVAAASADSQVVVYQPKETAKQVQSYWTAARIKSAKPVKVLNVEAPSVAEAQAEASALAAPAFEGAPSLPEVGGKSGSASAQNLASAQAVVEARVWKKHGTAPARTLGKLYFDVPGGRGSCSATVITAKNKRSLWTAGHCVHAGKGGGWYRNFAFFPDYPAKKVAWSVDNVVALNPWIRNSDKRYDIAAVTVRRKGGKGIQSTNGSQGYSFGYKKRKYSMYSFGYPADRLPGGKRYANNNLLRYCQGKTYAVNYGGGHIALGMSCTMGHGASGGSWIYGLNRKGYGRIAGLNSMHSLSTKAMYSPYHGSQAVAVYKAISKR
ncbi:trypsin-like serine peptidase [Spirillospora sp. NPDC048911]|uniref:trypsin-like serine peptidase n=1 Tax=Spirillospora sp. NPDC048911 TaxID=3364527 RepID=UPI003723F0D0